MKRAALFLLDHAVIVFFVAVMALFGVISPGFISLTNLQNLLVQASPTAILAAGMTGVLLVAGVDLSVGAVMFVTAAVAGKLIIAGAPTPVALVIIALMGLLAGLMNGLIVTRLGVTAFIATLGTLSIGRGAGLWITQTRAMNLPEVFLQIGSSRVAGIPIPLLVCGIVLGGMHLLLARTVFGRQLYAAGHSPAKAVKAGISIKPLVTWAYVICGCCAAIGGILALAQLGAVSPKFGLNREFAAIAAAVLGGTSLFGGRGAILPGSLLGAVLIQAVENGLVTLNADPYLYPLVTSAVIFLTVLLDTTRQRIHARLSRRRIF